MEELLQRLMEAVSGDLSQVALELAAEREVLPTSLSSAEIAEEFSQAVRGRSVFSARTTSAVYLQEVKDAVDLILQGGYENDLPMMRMKLKELLTWLGYDPETGFPGDEGLDIPPAEAGSLRDLRSDRRIDLMLETQLSLQTSASQKQRGLEPGRKRRWPAWELVRKFRRDVPRGEGETLSWGERWMRAGGPLVPGGRLVALKDDPIWRKLGSKEFFDDAIGVEIPPFAYQSGYRWREVSRSEAMELGLLPAREAVPTAEPGVRESLPEPAVSLRGMDEDLRGKLIDGIKAKRAEKPDHVRYSERLEREVERARESYEGRAAA